jgi:hypothetical protein
MIERINPYICLIRETKGNVRMSMTENSNMCIPRHIGQYLHTEKPIFPDAPNHYTVIISVKYM